MNALTSPMAWTNIILVVLALAVPSIKDLLTPEFEIAALATVNGLIAIYERIRDKGM